MSVTVGGELTTVTMADCEIAPPLPLHVTVKVVVVVGATCSDPEGALLPDQPSEAVQAVVLVLDQDRVDDWPGLIDVGLAVKVTVG
ncbi:hypothetical protein [Povalibacter sp.]|uniref:hypothetical protein n=1 Tax=Povalibacter sp. TaxID=1962978 RepID=UPI002F3F0D98